MRTRVYAFLVLQFQSFVCLEYVRGMMMICDVTAIAKKKNRIQQYFQSLRHIKGKKITIFHVMLNGSFVHALALS